MAPRRCRAANWRRVPGGDIQAPHIDSAGDLASALGGLELSRPGDLLTPPTLRALALDLARVQFTGPRAKAPTRLAESGSRVVCRAMKVRSSQWTSGPEM